MKGIITGITLSILSLPAIADMPNCNTGAQHSVDTSIIKFKTGYLAASSRYIKACAISFNNDETVLSNVLSEDMDICNMAQTSQKHSDIVSIHYCFTGTDNVQNPISTNPRIISISTQNSFSSTADPEG